MQEGRPSIQLALPYCLGIPAHSVGGGRYSWPPPSRLGRVAEFGALPSYVPAPLKWLAFYELPEEFLRFALVQVNDLHSVPFSGVPARFLPGSSPTLRRSPS